LRIVGDIGLEADLDGLARYLHREGVERQIEAETPGLQIGFFQRPVVEEALGRGGLRQPAQRFDLFRREEPKRGRQRRHPTRHGLDIDADGLMPRHDAGDAAVGVRQAEMQRARCPG
jgi:hypothetical protein